jgi:hypothetical protein
MAPFSAVNAAFQRLVRDAGLSVEDFGVLASELWRRSGWTADEYKAMANGRVVVIEASAD